MKYDVTTDNSEWTDRDIIVKLFSDGTASPRNKVGYVSDKRSPVRDAIKNAETWLTQEAQQYERIIIHLMDGVELPEDLI
ncbi:hypothetical protein [Brucella thiophenivorans]|uniref:Uncharacterized protein n=1 Tax=Brucella thiophenivorans TaxID=571255 RepID=A0A256FDZ8_9HYPH|nr:hypothetical protein [Brucella thiophenivorans]OYR13023.1 hypothetical protein CEV31_3530 [Brucella thiophenivorans]